MQDLKSKIESLLFISAKSMSIKSLAELMSVKVEQVEQAGDELVAELKAAHRGIQIIRNKESLQMVSSPENAELIQAFVKDETTGELSRPALETLTIIAYRGPVSKMDINRIRGVNCSLILRNLLLRGLIEQKDDKTKNESYYIVTFDFIRFLGLSSVQDLPNYAKLNKHETLEKMLEDIDENI